MSRTMTALFQWTTTQPTGGERVCKAEKHIRMALRIYRPVQDRDDDDRPSPSSP
jgi:hypothetical protein